MPLWSALPAKALDEGEMCRWTIVPGQQLQVQSQVQCGNGKMR